MLIIYNKIIAFLSAYDCSELQEKDRTIYNAVNLYRLKETREFNQKLLKEYGEKK